MAICVRRKINCHFGVFQRLNWEAALWSAHISACFMSPGITSISNFEKCNERWCWRIGRSEQMQEFKLHAHFFLPSFSFASCSSVTFCCQHRTSSSANIWACRAWLTCARHTQKKRNRRKRKAAHYAGIKVKQLSSFWKPILFLIRLLHFLTSSQSSRNIASTLSCSVLGLIWSAAFGRVPLPPWISIPAFPPVCTWLRSALDWILLSL